MAKSSARERQEVLLQVPDLGLSDAQLSSLKKAFKTQLVSTMGDKVAARPRIVIIRIRVVRATKEI